MPAPDPVIDVVREWLAKADNDLTTAAHTLTLGADCPTDTVSFHAQQCVEKYLKALLVFRAIPFPKTHNIRVLRALLPPKLRPKLGSTKAQDRLTQYATILRYPGSGPEVPLAEARKAVALARRVRKEVRRHLPRAALRRQGK
jgi:HEPN domain-containing protein